MKRLNTQNKIVLGILIAVLLIGAAPAAAQAAGDSVRFRVDNRAERSITIRLYATDSSGLAYYMSVEGKSIKDLFPVAGVYTYRLTACGVMVKGTVDLTKNLTWVNPECGDKGGPGTGASNTQDVGQILKLTKFTIINDTGASLKIWLDGPWQYVFIIPEGGKKTVSILKGVYEYGHYACGGLVDGHLTADPAHRSRTFDCP